MSELQLTCDRCLAAAHGSCLNADSCVCSVCHPTRHKAATKVANKRRPQTEGGNDPHGSRGLLL
jgi:hypothetical protein